MRNSIWLLGAVVLSACGPAGILSGKVTVEGGTPGGVAVIVYGPQSAATVTGDDGAFSVGSLPDGKYVVRATVRGADVEEVSVATTITQGKASPEPILSFRASTAKVTGKVVMSDGSDAANLTVTALGAETRGARTAADGSFTFEGLKTGAYLISVEALDTREGHVGVGVNASGTIDAGELRLTPIGRFGGTVSYNAMPAAGVTVVVPGTSVSAVTDATGRYQFDAVPTGNQAVSVRLGTAPYFRSASAMVMVMRGANPDVPLTLMDEPPKTGTVTGTVTFHGPRSPVDISVFALGSGVTTTPQINGAYSLTLPVGTWDVVASAPQHPQKLLGRVTVRDGATQSLPGAEVSWLRSVWTSASFIGGPITVASGQTDTVSWSLVTFTDSVDRLALISSTTYDFRILAAGTTYGHRISKNGKYAGWFVSNAAYVYEIGTATLSVFAAPRAVMQLEFSSDESALFITRVGPTLSRIKFASPTTVDTYPPTGNSTGISYTTVDRWFVRDSTNDIRLVTPRTDVPQVFTQVTTFSPTPTAWALTNCAATCDLRVLSPTSESTALRDSSVSPLLAGFTSFSAMGATHDNRGDYPCFSTGSNAFCVKSSDASHFSLLSVPTSFRLNEAGDRVIATYTNGLNLLVREEPMPPVPSTANLGSNLVGWTTGWLSPTRAYAYENSGSPRTLHLVKAGVDTPDADVGSQAVTARPPLMVFPQSSTSRWRAIIGDGPTRAIDVATSIAVSGTSVRGLGTGPITKYGMVSFDITNAYIVDEVMAAVRQTFQGYVPATTTSYRSGALEYSYLYRSTGTTGFFVYNTNVVLEFNESSAGVYSQIGALGVQAWMGLAEDGKTLIVGSFQP